MSSLVTLYTMTYEMMVGLTVTDDVLYQQYRDAMAPLLAAHGGGFRHDFTIQKVLRSASEHPQLRSPRADNHVPARRRRLQDRS